MKIEKVDYYLITPNLPDKTEYIRHIRNLKQALNKRLVFKKAHKLIKFIQNARLKSYIAMNADLRKTEKNDFENKIYLGLIF